MRTYYGDLVNGQKFVLEVAKKDAKGFHAGYGPGTRIFTKGGYDCPVLIGSVPVYPR